MLYQLSYYRRVKTPQGVFLSAKIGRTFDSARGFHLCFRLQIQRAILRKHLPSVSKTAPIWRPCSYAPLQLLFTSSREAGIRVSIIASHIDTHLWRRVGVLRSLADEEVQHTTQTQDYYSKSCSLFRVLRHGTPSSPIGLSEVTEQALRLIARILLIQRKKKYPSREEKSAFT